MTGLDGVEAWARLDATYSRRTFGNHIQSATWVHVPKASERRESSEAIDHAV